MTCAEAVKEVARIIYVVHDEVKDKAFELELSWVGDSRPLHGCPVILPLFRIRVELLGTVDHSNFVPVVCHGGSLHQHDQHVYTVQKVVTKTLNHTRVVVISGDEVGPCL